MDRPAFTTRDATAEDAGFIELMVLVATIWTPDRQMTLDQLRREPDLTHYVAGWPQESDIGLIAEDRDSKPAGSYGFITFQKTTWVTATSAQTCPS